MSYELIWETRGVVKRFYGELTGQDMVQSVVDVEADPRFDICRYVINDFLPLEGIAPVDNVIDYIAAIDSAAAETNPNIRIAVVTASPEIIALATQYANSPLNAYPTRIFATLAEARAWIATPP